MRCWPTATRVCDTGPTSPASKLPRELLPLLRADERPEPAALGAYAVDLPTCDTGHPSPVLPFTDAEMAALDKVAEDATVVTRLLTTDPALSAVSSYNRPWRGSPRCSETAERPSRVCHQGPALRPRSGACHERRQGSLAAASLCDLC